MMLPVWDRPDQHSAPPNENALTLYSYQTCKPECNHEEDSFFKLIVCCSFKSQCHGRQIQSEELQIKVKESEVTQSCLTLCYPMDCSLPGSSVHGIFQARVLEWVAISFSRGSSQPRDQTWVSLTAGRPFTID